MASIRQWDTDWQDQFKQIFTTSMTNLQLWPTSAIEWLNVVNMAFGKDQAQRGIRVPDQSTIVSKGIEYADKYAERQPQVADMPSITDSLRIKEEYYAGDTVNAIGHVGDIGKNFIEAIAHLALVGSAANPLAYGLLDGGATTGNTTVARPDMCDDVSTAGAWTTPNNLYLTVAAMEAELIDKGFFGRKILATHPLAKGYLNMVMTSTTTPLRGWINMVAGYEINFHPLWDRDATKDAIDLYMIDTDMHDLFMTPIKARGFFDNNTEDFIWHWQTRLYLLSRPLNDGTDWNKGIVKCTVDIDT